MEANTADQQPEKAKNKGEHEASEDEGTELNVEQRKYHETRAQRTMEQQHHGQRDACAQEDLAWNPGMMTPQQPLLSPLMHAPPDSTTSSSLASQVPGPMMPG